MFEGIGAFFSRLWTDISGWFVNIYDQFCFVFVEKDRYKQMFTGLRKYAENNRRRIACGYRYRYRCCGNTFFIRQE